MESAGTSVMPMETVVPEESATIIGMVRLDIKIQASDSYQILENSVQ